VAAVSDPSPRYVVREITGYGMSGGAKWARETTDYMILDRWYSHRVVASFPPRRGLDVDSRRRRCRNAALQLNAEHEEWLTSVDVTPRDAKGCAR
jgi:hypothetical protein